MIATPLMPHAIAALAGTAALLIGASRRYDGPMGKSDRALAFGAIAFLLAVGLPAGRWLDLVLVVLLVLLVLTIMNRVRRALAEAHP